MANSALRDSGSVEIAGLLRNTLTSHSNKVIGMHEYFKFIRVKSDPVSEDCIKSVIKIHLLIPSVFHWVQAVPTLYRDTSACIFNVDCYQKVTQ